MDLGQTLFDTRSRPRMGFFRMREDAIIHVLRAIIDGNHLLFEKVREGKFDRLQAGRLHFSSNAGDRRDVTADLGILADAKQQLPPLKPRRLLNPLQHFRRRRYFLDVWSCGGG